MSINKILNNKNPTSSESTHDLAIYLSDKQIDIIRSDEKLGGKLIAEKLSKLRDEVWGKKNSVPHISFSQKNKESIFDSILQGLDDTQKSQLVSAYAKMGYLYEVAALSSRNNHLENLRSENKKTPPGGGEDFVNLAQNKNKPTGELVENLSQPVFEVIMTAHPTNVNSLESMKVQREVAIALENKNDGQLTEKIRKYLETSIPPLDSKGNTRTLTARDETENMLYSLSNIYEDLPRVYKNYDRALSNHANKKNDSYNPEDLNLQIRLGSWGSGGDKDGNKNVTAETTLEAIALHTKTALENYKKDLEKIPALAEWKESFEQKLSSLNPLLEQISELRQDAKEVRAENKPDITAKDLSDRFDRLSQNLMKLRNDLDVKKFEDAVLAQVKTGDNKEESLNLLRRFRVFGFNFGKIEYRETAKEYNRVVEAIVPDYKGTPEEKVEFLTNLLISSQKNPADYLKEKIGEIIENGAGKAYDDKNSAPIAYHTIKRMQLARDFSDIIKDNVLAECGKLEFKDKNRLPTDIETTHQGVSNILEAQFLQRAVEYNGRRATLGIIPLFEETSTMANVDKIMREAYQNSAYKEQLKLLQQDDSQPTQQIMIAHSDNARRSGSMAARAYIHDAHKKLRALGEEMGINTQFYEGGSITDIYRNGVLAISKSVNSFRSHLFAKHTFQGGDLLAYFNHPASTERLFDRSFGHQAKYLEKNNDGKWSVIKDTASNQVVDDIAIAAMKRTYNDYIKHDFRNEKMGELLEKLDYSGYLAASNISSRATGRDDKNMPSSPKKLAFKQGSSTQMGAASFVNIETARTIGYSMSQQVAAILPAFLGAEKLGEYLKEEIEKKHKELATKDKSNLSDSEKEFLSELKIENGKNLEPKQLNFIYKKSPAFHNGHELLRASYMLTNLDKTEKIIRSHMSYAGDDKEAINTKMQNDSYWRRIKNTYKKVAKPAYEAITGMPYGQNQEDLPHTHDHMNDKTIIKVGGDTYNDKLGYFDFILNFREKNPQLFNKENITNDDKSMVTARNIAASSQSVLNGRWLEFSDPTWRIVKDSNAIRI